MNRLPALVLLTFAFACNESKPSPAKDTKADAAKPATTVANLDDLLGVTGASEAPSSEAPSHAETPHASVSGASPASSPSSTDAGASSSEKASEKAPGKATTQADVILLNAGAEPKKPLRYKFDKGNNESFIFELKMVPTIEVNGKKEKPPTAPSLKFAFTAVPLDINPEGSAGVEWAISRIDIAAPPGDKSATDLRQAWEPLKGPFGKSIVTSRGITQHHKFQPKEAVEGSDAIVDQLARTLADLTVPLPEEPVGKGAKWKRKYRVPSIQIELVEEQTYELIEEKDDTIRVESKVTETAPRQEVAGPGGNAKLIIEKYEGSGKVTSLVDLKRLIPKADSNLTHLQVITAHSANEKATQKLSTVTTMKVSPEGSIKPH